MLPFLFAKKRIVEMARYYLNRGIILEQVIVSLIHDYLDAIDADNLYSNFHIEATNSHPFASLYLHNNKRAADCFPAIIVATAADDKTPDLADLKAWITPVEFSAADIDDWASNTYDADFTDTNGHTVKAGKKIPGLCAVTSKDVIKELKKIVQRKGTARGHRIEMRRTDRISIEIWADNEQVKNEVYEILRLFVAGDLRHILAEKYNFFDPLIDDGSVHGQRSNNYNMDFDIPLSGAMISFEVNYLIAQVVFDTSEARVVNDIEAEARNYVKHG